MKAIQNYDDKYGCLEVTFYLQRSDLTNTKASNLTILNKMEHDKIVDVENLYNLVDDLTVVLFKQLQDKEEQQ